MKLVVTLVPAVAAEQDRLLVLLILSAGTSCKGEPDSLILRARLASSPARTERRLTQLPSPRRCSARSTPPRDDSRRVVADTLS